MTGGGKGRAELGRDGVAQGMRGVGCQLGAKEGMRDEGEQGMDGWMDGWLEGWPGRGVGMLMSFSAQDFTAHTAFNTRLHAEQGGATKPHMQRNTHTHTET